MTSQINPNNIDGTYPVAGQPNNTQGFRDNFTNIKTNFATAKTEITDLENKVIVKQALTGTTIDNNMADNLIYAVKLQDVSYTYVQQTITAGAIPIDYAAGQYQSVSPTGNVSLSFSNWPVSGSEGVVYIDFIITNIAYTVTLPVAVSVGTTGIQGYSANVITFGATGTYRFAFSTVDSGTTIAIYDLNRPLSSFTNPVTISSTTDSTSITSGALVVAGGVGIAGNVYVGGDIFGNISISDLTLSNVVASGYITATGNITGANMMTAGLISSTGNVTSGNVRTAGLITATGNVTGGNILTAGVVSATANITGGNILTAGVVSATANITGGNILTAGLISVTGNITGGNVLGGANVNAITHTGTTVSVTANITGGNILTAGLISATSTITGAGNITGGNILTAGLISSTGNGIHGNILTAGLISATGNIQGGNILGGANVNATTHTGTTVSVTANITGGNILTGGVVSVTGNITGGNVSATAHTGTTVAVTGAIAAQNATAIPAGGTTGAGYTVSSTANFGVFFGSGVPTLSAAKGSLYLRSDGSTTNDRMYVNTNGTTGWTAVITAS